MSATSRIGIATVAAASAIACLTLLGVASALSVGGALAGAGGGYGLAGGPEGVSAFARADIPPRYLRLYLAAARRYGLDWSILAGIGRVECDHGRDPAPSCTRQGVENSAGAGGPMQFIASTWARYGVDGDGDGRIDRWDPADAIYSAANYLRASGAPSHYGAAIYSYNHATWYVEEVERWAGRYRAKAGEGGAESGAGSPGSGAQGLGSTSTPVLYTPGSQAKLLRGDGHVALIPAAAPRQVQAMVIAGNELQDLLYGPAGHPDPLGAPSEDCSSTVNYVLYRSGVRSIAEIVKDNPLAQDYVHWGDPGPGRWVTIYSTDVPSPHVFMTIAGLRLDTVGGGTDEGPNRSEGGPRWRLLPYIPAWAHWSVRHPPGL